MCNPIGGGTGSGMGTCAEAQDEKTDASNLSTTDESWWDQNMPYV